jgi:hypothetical protein
MAHEYHSATKEIRCYDDHLKILAFLDVCLLELGEGVFNIVIMGQGGILEIFFDLLSCVVLHFLLNRLESRIPDSARSASFTFSAVRGFMMSTVRNINQHTYISSAHSKRVSMTSSLSFLHLHMIGSEFK